MIASLRGFVQHVLPDRMIIEVRGVGYEVLTCVADPTLLPDIGEEIFMHVYTSVREDAITLFGFLTPEEKEMYLQLINVSGVGPRLAQNILSAALPAELASSILLEDLPRLTKLPGVGKKTAERLCLELKDKLQKMSFSVVEPNSETQTPSDQVSMDAISALVNLGYPQMKAREALRNVRRQLGGSLEGTPLEEILRLALRSLA